MSESQTLHLGDNGDGAVEEEVIDTRRILSIKQRLPPRGDRIIEKTFEMHLPGPFERRDIALTAARLSNSAVWSALPLDFRAWAQSLATVIVMFRGQPDHEWLVANCEQNPNFLMHVSAEVEAYQAASFPEEFVVGEGEASEVVPALEVATLGARRTAKPPSKPERRRPGVASVR